MIRPPLLLALFLVLAMLVLVIPIASLWKSTGLLDADRLPTARAASLVSQTRSLRSTWAPTVRLVVEEVAYHQQEQALTAGDTAALAQIWRTYEHLDVAANTNVRIRKWSGNSARVEVLAGRHKGRSGWVLADYLQS